MHAAQSYQKLGSVQYIEALLQCANKKVCTNLANTMNVSHDSMYRSFDSPIDKTNKAIDELKSIALRSLSNEELYLIFDDTQITKLYAKQIEGLELSFDGSLGMPTMGIKMVTALLTDGKLNVPIDAIPFVSKELAQNSYKTKSEIAILITKKLINVFKFKRVLADAHYATKQLLHFLDNAQINYLMKIPCNRVVTIGESTGQLKHIFRLKRNAHVQMSKGIFNGIECYFYAIKIRTGSVIYLVSNNQIDPYKVVETYRIRWSIEIFHRVAKQYLGLSDCQMQSIEKQRQHVIYVMLAYAIAGIKRLLMGLPCVEHVINHLRDVNSMCIKTSKTATAGNFAYVA
jgi:SRSO17 transposase